MSLDLVELSNSLNSSMSDSLGFTSAWVYRNRVVAVDFKVHDHRIAFNLEPKGSSKIEVKLFFRDNDTLRQKQLLAKEPSGRLKLGEVVADENAAASITALIKEAFGSHELLQRQKARLIDGKEIVTYSKPTQVLGDGLVSSQKDAFSIADVIERDICIGCGACSVVTDGRVEIGVNDKGMHFAQLRSIEQLSEADFKAADAVCPFSDAAANEDELGAPKSETEPMPVSVSLGQYQALIAGRENDDRRLVGSSSGGLTSWLLKALVESGRVDGVIHVGHTYRDDRLFEYRLSFTAGEIDEFRKSLYYSTTLADVLKEAKSYKGRTFAIVGVPCFIKAARLLAESDSEFKKTLKYFVGIVCGHMKSSFFAEANSWQIGVPPENIRKVDFRVKTPDKKSNEYKFASDPKFGNQPLSKRPGQLIGGSWGHGFFQPNACNFCDDVFAETADAVFGDAWLPKYKDDWRGTNIAAIRNKEIVDILQNGNYTDEIQIENIGLSDIVKSQAGGLRHRRDGLRVRLQDDLTEGFKVPKKRVEAGYEGVPQWRQRLVRQRRKMSERSFETFSNAKHKGDLAEFTEPMQKEIELYKFLERSKFPEAKKNNRKYDVALFGWHHQGNLGGVLTFFALHQILTAVGLKVLVVWRPSRTKMNIGNTKNYAILKDFYEYSEVLPPNRLHELRDLCDTFALASDQLWAGKWVPFNPEYEFLGAGDDSVKKISVATSFGGDGANLPVTDKREAIVTHLLQDMDYVSVREPSGVNILNKIDVEATQILDPVFLAGPKVYDQLAERATIDIPQEKYLLGYILDAEKHVVNFGKDDLKRSLQLPKAHFMTTVQNDKSRVEAESKWANFDGLNFHIDANLADFIKTLSNADFVFTDSFHGACFATIFHRPFICCPPSHRGNSRFALFDQLGLASRILGRNELDISLVSQSIDWADVDRRLAKMRSHSLDWMSKAFGRDFIELREELKS